MPAQTLAGKVVAIGGGAKNLGGLISLTLGADGARLAVHYNSEATAGAAEETVKAVKKSGGEAFAIEGDLRRVPEVVRLFDETQRRYGTVNIAINTVGKVLKSRSSKPAKPNTTRCSPSIRRQPISSFAKRQSASRTTATARSSRS